MSEAPMRFRVTAADDRSLRRVIELAPSHSLADLRDTIVTEFRLDPNDPWVYFLSGERLDRESEFARDGGVGGRRGRDVRVGELGLVPGDVVAFFSGFTDERRLEVEVVEAGAPDEPLAAPRVVQREGAPKPRKKPALEEELTTAHSRPALEEELTAAHSLAPREAGGEGQGEGGKEDAAPRTPDPAAPTLSPSDSEELRAALDAWDHRAEDRTGRIALDPARVAAVATAVLDAAPTSAQLDALSATANARLASWLGDAIRAVAARGDAEVALRLAERFAATVGQREPVVNAALVLAEAGRADEARRALDAAARVDAPLTQRVRLAIAQVELMLGDAAGAEAELRRIVSSRWPSPKVRPLAARGLAGILTHTDRADEAQAVLAAERLRAEAAAGVVRRAAPRVGRNDPCPCGSGKKAKHCCGA